MVGTAMAAALGNEPLFKGKKVLLLEGAPNKRLEALPEKFASRTCALSVGSVRLLSSFGAWDNICNMRCQPVKHMQVWDACANAMITFHKDQLMEDPLAYIAENDVILSGIVQRLETLGSNVVQVKYNARVKSYKLPSTTKQPWVEINTDDGQTFRAKLLIGADGLKSLVRQTARLHTVQWNYGQSALVATLTVTEDTENTTAWQRFLPDGPIAMLPLSNRVSNLIWTTTPEHAKELAALPTESFVDAVNSAFTSDKYKDSVVQSAELLFESIVSSLGLRRGDRLEQQLRLPPTVISVVDESRASFPLSLCHATHYVSDRVALIGDAAHRMHPLAGQGVNLGFGDVTCLRQHLLDAIRLGSDLGCMQHLLAYETDRQRSAVPMMAFVDMINRLYSNSCTPVVFMRSVGCEVAHNLSPIKKQMISFAMG
jgi:ubiquinone biosynthesis monooxygenase Coq6